MVAVAVSRALLAVCTTLDGRSEHLSEVGDDKSCSSSSLLSFNFDTSTSPGLLLVRARDSVTLYLAFTPALQDAHLPFIALRFCQDGLLMRNLPTLLPPSSISSSSTPPSLISLPPLPVPFPCPLPLLPSSPHRSPFFNNVERIQGVLAASRLRGLWRRRSAGGLLAQRSVRRLFLLFPPPFPNLAFCSSFATRPMLTPRRLQQARRLLRSQL